MTTQRNRGPEMAGKNVLDAQEAAGLLGAHVETLRRLARKGAVPAYKIGKDWRFNKQTLTRWLENQQGRHQAPLVLVVDDEPGIRNVLTAFMKQDGYRVTAAADGQQALAAAQRALPDVVLLDLMLPDMHGVAVLKALRNLKADLPVIMITGYPDSRLIAEALLHPPVTLLPKPVAGDVLLKTVRMVLDGARRG